MQLFILSCTPCPHMRARVTRTHVYGEWFLKTMKSCKVKGFDAKGELGSPFVPRGRETPLP